MDKFYSYENFNDNSNNNKLFDYLFYIVIFILVIFVIVKMSKYDDLEKIKYDVIDNFQIVTPNVDRDTYCNQLDKTVDFYKKENNDLKKTINQIKINELISKNYVKYSDALDPQNTLFNENYVLDGIPNTAFSYNDKNNFIINNEFKLNKYIIDTKNFKNIYKPGDIVDKPSSFNIGVKNICFSNIDQNDVKNKNLQCMVCSVNKTNYSNPNDKADPDNEYLKSDSWKKTKTNINKICIFNNDTTDPNVLNYEQCKNFCTV